MNGRRRQVGWLDGRAPLHDLLTSQGLVMWITAPLSRQQRRRDHRLFGSLMVCVLRGLRRALLLAYSPKKHETPPTWVAQCPVASIGKAQVRCARGICLARALHARAMLGVGKFTLTFRGFGRERPHWNFGSIGSAPPKQQTRHFLVYSRLKNKLSGAGTRKQQIWGKQSPRADPSHRVSKRLQHHEGSALTCRQSVPPSRQRPRDNRIF